MRRSRSVVWPHRCCCVGARHVAGLVRYHWPLYAPIDVAKVDNGMPAWRARLFENNGTEVLGSEISWAQRVVGRSFGDIAAKA